MNRREFTYALSGPGALLANLKTASGGTGQASSQPAAQQAGDETSAYRNPKLAIEERVADLLKRMTLEEKVEQISGGFRYGGVVDPTANSTTGITARRSQTCASLATSR